MTTKAELVEAILLLDDTSQASARWKKPELEAERDRLLAKQTNGDGVEAETLGDLRERLAEADAKPGPDVGVDPHEIPSTDLALHEQPDTLPAYSRWMQMEAMADKLAKSSLVPEPLRKKPADVLLILLAGHDIGIPATQALQKLHVIKGRVGMAAELMVALVVAQGHDIWPDPANNAEHATAHGQRKGSERDGAFTFTMDDARKAQLVNDGTWSKYPKAMLWARAVSGLVRQMFPDCTSGISYTPEELGSIDVEGFDSPMANQEPAPVRTDAADDVKQSIRDRLAELTDEQRTCVRGEWKAERLFPIDQLHADEVGAVMRLIADCVAANPEDAVVVPDDTADPDPADELAVDQQGGVAEMDECRLCGVIDQLDDDGYCEKCRAQPPA